MYLHHHNLKVYYSVEKKKKNLNFLKINKSVEKKKVYYKNVISINTFQWRDSAHTYTCIYYCSTETITALSICYTPIQNVLGTKNK